jgi:hypothetical protein
LAEEAAAREERDGRPERAHIEREHARRARTAARRARQRAAPDITPRVRSG